MALEGIVATLPGDLSPSELLQLGDALLASPVAGVAIVQAGAGCFTAVSDLRQRARAHMQVGLWASSDVDISQQAVAAGAQFLITPTFLETAAAVCHAHALPYWPQLPHAQAAQVAQGEVAGGVVEASLLPVLAPQRLALLATGVETETAVVACRRAGAVGLLLTEALFTGAGQKMADLIRRARFFRHSWLAAAAT